MSSAEANMGGSATDDYILDCAGSAADTTAVTWDFPTNLTTGTLTVRGDRAAPDSDGFYSGNLVISTGHYRLDTGDVSVCCGLNEINSTVDGFQVLPSHSGANGVGIRINTNTYVVKKIRGRNDSSTDFGVGYSGVGAFGGTIEDCLFVNFSVNGIQSTLGATARTVNIYHNTVYGSGGGSGISCSATSSVSTFNIKGNAVANSGASADIAVSLGTGPAVVNYADNALEDFDLGTTDEIDLGATTDAWTSPGTAASDDFTVKNTSSALYNAVNPTLVTTDITDFTRDGTNHDVGAFELVVAAATSGHRVTGGGAFGRVIGE
jgi:hypothetical protein